MSVTKQQALDAYNAGSPIISDAEWDRMFMMNDGSDSLGNSGKIKLPEKMGSLRKLFIGEDALPEDIDSYVETPKFDGCAVGIIYRNGSFYGAITRGDGEKGQDVSSKLEIISNVPDTIPEQGFVWVTGELVALKTVDNPRNYVAGFLNAKEGYRDKASSIIFVAYDMTYGEITSRYDTLLIHMKKQGFATVATVDSISFPTDGVVYRYRDNHAFYESGFTGNYKNKAFALKERSSGVETTLIDIVWQTGKSGKVTPVALLESVNIGGANVSRATLHNFSFIEDLGLYKGARVMVERSGEIIPRIIGLASS